MSTTLKPAHSSARLHDGGPVYLVRKILSARRRGKGLQYLVDWEGRCSVECCWIPSGFVLDLTLVCDLHTFNPEPSGGRASLTCHSFKTKPYSHCKGIKGQAYTQHPWPLYLDVSLLSFRRPCFRYSFALAIPWTLDLFSRPCLFTNPSGLVVSFFRPCLLAQPHWTCWPR